MSPGTQLSMNGSAAYATVDDFCRIFSEEMERLYLLALLLTADASKAEDCFVVGIGDIVEGNPVFREWAYSWARRTIIQNAIRMIEPARQNQTTPRATPATPEIHPRLSAVFKLNTLDRFVFVMSVLEGYSHQDCAILLGCSRQAVANARARALEHLANGVDVTTIYGGSRPSNKLPRRGNLWVTGTSRIAARTSARARGEDNAG